LTTARVQITNNSSRLIPALSSTENPFRLSWRFIGAQDLQPISSFDTRQDLAFDIPSHTSTLLTVELAPPAQAGTYLLEVTAVQELIAWFFDQGTPIAVSDQLLIVDGKGNVLVNP
jgi:hypothetical protein